MIEEKTTVTAESVMSAEIEKQLEQQNKNYLSPMGMGAYIISGIGDKNFDTFNGANRLFYSTTFLNANPLMLSASDTFTGFIDALDNAVSGPILDRTRTRWGRVRPYLILTLPFWFISAFFPWVFPDSWSQTQLFVSFTVCSYIGSIASSFYTPAYSAILYNLTPNVEERNRLIAADAYVDLLGVWLPSMFTFFVDYLPRTIPTRSIYMGGAFIFIFNVIIFRIYGFFKLRERVPLASRETMQETGIWKSIKQVAGCRPMWILILKNFFAVGKATGAKVESFFWLNNMGKLSYGSIAGFFTGLPSYFVLPFASKLTKKMGLRNLCSSSYLMGGLVYFLLYFVGYKPTGNSIVNFVWLVIALTLAGAPNSLQRYSSIAMQGDLYDYVEWKTGIRNEGMITAVMGYFSILANWVANLLSGVIINAIKYKPLLNEFSVVVPQTDPVMLKRIWMVFALAPAIGRTLKGITLRFFNVHGNVREQMMKDLAVQRAAKVIDGGGTGSADGVMPSEK